MHTSTLVFFPLPNATRSDISEVRAPRVSTFVAIYTSFRWWPTPAPFALAGPCLSIATLLNRPVFRIVAVFVVRNARDVYKRIG